MQFSENSNVSLVITSCGRFKLLKRTLESFDNYNTYPIKKLSLQKIVVMKKLKTIFLNIG